jgi:hypothetical protein
MSNYDAGHYFLTVFAPIRLDSVLIDGQSHSRRHLIREALATMPTGEMTVASLGNRRDRDNPFARCTMTHFARFAVLDDLVFNGRLSGDTLISKIRGVNPLTPQKVDRLSTPFLIFTTDFDAANGGDDALRTYLTNLWTTMHEELAEIFQHCFGFESVTTAEGFFSYIKKCQIETTLPFNDYWSVVPDLKDLDLKPYGLGVVGALFVALVAFLIAFIGLSLAAPLFAAGSLGVGLAAALLAYGVGLLGYRKIMDTGALPFPTSPPPAPSSDLPTILKALFLQRPFTDFAIDAQGKSDQALFDDFGRFITDNKPQNLAEPTQRPGVIGV